MPLITTARATAHWMMKGTICNGLYYADSMAVCTITPPVTIDAFFTAVAIAKKSTPTQPTLAKLSTTIFSAVALPLITN